MPNLFRIAGLAFALLVSSAGAAADVETGIHPRLRDPQGTKVEPRILQTDCPPICTIAADNEPCICGVCDGDQCSFQEGGGGTVPTSLLFEANDDWIAHYGSGPASVTFTKGQGCTENITLIDGYLKVEKDTCPGQAKINPEVKIELPDGSISQFHTSCSEENLFIGNKFYLDTDPDACLELVGYCIGPNPAEDCSDLYDPLECPVPSEPAQTPAPTKSPTSSPTKNPTLSPTKNPTVSPTKNPTVSPTKNPTVSPTKNPTVSPTKNPTVSPTKNPTVSPTKNPTVSPTKNPTVSPTKNPTVSPTKNPTLSPTTSPTNSPTESPTQSPTMSPTPEKCPAGANPDPCLCGVCTDDEDCNQGPFCTDPKYCGGGCQYVGPGTGEAPKTLTFQICGPSTSGVDFSLANQNEKKDCELAVTPGDDDKFQVGLGTCNGQNLVPEIIITFLNGESVQVHTSCSLSFFLGQKFKTANYSAFLVGYETANGVNNIDNQVCTNDTCAGPQTPPP